MASPDGEYGRFINPYYSSYLPLSIFAIIQLFAAVLQQYWHPYENNNDANAANRAEMGSLCLIQISYLTQASPST